MDVATPCAHASPSATRPQRRARWAGDAPPPPPSASLLALPAELLAEALARLPPADLVRASGACTAFRDAADAATGGATAALRRVRLAPTLNQGELCASLGLTADEARALPHAVETRKLSYTRGRYTTHWFDAEEVVERLVAQHGWTWLDARLATVLVQHRKRDALVARREEAAAARRAALDAWLTREAPLGAHIDSVDAWEASLAARDGARPSSHALLRAFLGSATLGCAHTLDAASAAVVFHEHAQQRAIARREAQATELAARKEAEGARRRALLGALRRHRLGRAADACAYDEFVRTGASCDGLTDAAAVAEAIAGRGERAAALTAALERAGLRRGQWARECDAYERSGRVAGRPTTASEFVQLLLDGALRPARPSKRDGARRCSTPGCGNVHRCASPAVGPHGPVCGKCERR